MKNFGARTISDVEFDPCSIAKAVGSVFKTAGLSHGGILFEQHGRVAKIGAERYNIPDTLHFSCDRLVFSGRHPAFAAAKSRRTPFDMLALVDDYRSDPQFRDFVDVARAHDIRSIFAFPLRDFSGRLLVASGLRFGREMTELELRLTHTFCLDALDSLGAPGAQRPPAPLLSPRERECLIAAGRGETEKDTARNFGISPSTVHAHIESCKRKLGVKNKIEAIINALRRGEIRTDDL